MAMILPSDWETLELTPDWPAEGETLKYLRDHVPDELVVFHGVHWTRAAHHFTEFGEIDFCVVSPSGRVLAIEQKNGVLSEGPDGLSKQYGSRTKNVARQLQRNLDGLRKKFEFYSRWKRTLNLDYLLYLPEHRVANINAAGLDPRRIVDARDRTRLAQVVSEVLSDGHEPDADHYRAVTDFLAETLELVPDANALIQATTASYTRLTGGLSEWAQALEFSPFRLRVIGTAGSGKTQLALAEFRKAIAAGRRPLFVCFNQPLAVRMREIVPAGGKVVNFHSLCREVVDPHGERFDYARMGGEGWERLAAEAAARPVTDEFQFDSLIVDEGQDMEPAWASWLLTLLRPEGRLVWLEDPTQNLYGRPSIDLGQVVTLRTNVNYRSPRTICDAINVLLDLPDSCCCKGPNPGFDLGMNEYADEQDLLEQTGKVLARLIRQGYRKDDIAIVSYRGLERSVFRQINAVGDFRLKKFEGRYDAAGQQVMCPGDVRFETVFRFKGHQAPVILFTEVDFEELNDGAKRRLFCGMTRASLHLEMFVGPAGRCALAAHLHARG